MVPEIYGLVLAGGKSSRMGKDKGLIPYHGIPQRTYVYQLLSNVCAKAYMSVRHDQMANLSDDINVIADNDQYKGPYNGLLSAYQMNPDVAWLVLACDLPLMDTASLQQLISQRNIAVEATAFASRENPLPEPLCAIWEPRGLQNSLTYLKSGNGTCPRKFLIDAEVALVFPENPNVLLNANSEEEYQEAIAKIETS